MNICFVGKYPPIEGGVSRNTFWASFALAEAGFQVDVVTNATEVEPEFRILEDEALFPTLQPSGNGCLRRHDTIATSRNYIPWTSPFVSKLASLTADVVQAYDCDLIFAYYLEPYAVAAYLAAQWTGIPFGIRHAGSDVGRLFLSPQLKTTYTEVIRAADFIMASGGAYRPFLQLGVDLDRIYPIVPYQIPTDYFHPQAMPLDINQLLDRVREKPINHQSDRIVHQLADKPFVPSRPTVGIYGKIGETKGSFDLLRALGQLKAQGLSFNFLALTQGYQGPMRRFFQALREHDLEDVTWLLPFIPHWHIPQFIRACTAVCFLERGFAITAHTPAVPQEVLACGTCLVLSHEGADKQAQRSKLVHGQNVLLVDPQNSAQLLVALRCVIQNPAQAEAIGQKGYEAWKNSHRPFAVFGQKLAAAFTKIEHDVQARRQMMSIAEMQACLARLYVDDTFRQLFYRDTNTTLADYKLTQAETTALKSIDRKMLDLFAAGLKTRRKKKFQATYQLLFQLNKAEMDRYFDRYYQLYPARPGQSTLTQILEFGEFMEQTVATDTDLPPYAADVARYERLYYAARYRPSGRDSFDTAPSLKRERLALDSKPEQCQGVYLATFDYNIVELVGFLKQNPPIKTPLAEASCFVFQQIPNSLKPQVFQITLPTRDLLEQCDGQQSVAALITGMERAMNRTSLEARVMQILQQLLEMKLIRI